MKFLEMNVKNSIQTWYWRIVLKIILVYKSSFGEERGRFFIILNWSVTTFYHYKTTVTSSFPSKNDWRYFKIQFLPFYLFFFADKQMSADDLHLLLVGFSGTLHTKSRNLSLDFQWKFASLCSLKKKVGNKIRPVEQYPVIKK